MSCGQTVICQDVAKCWLSGIVAFFCKTVNLFELVCRGAVAIQELVAYHLHSGFQVEVYFK